VSEAAEIYPTPEPHSGLLDAATPVGSTIPPYANQHTDALVRLRNAWLPVAAVMFAVAWGGNEFTPLLVLYRQRGLGPVVVDGLLAAYVLGIVPALLLGGPLSDRWGRRPLLLPAAPIAALGSVILALGEGSAVLLAIGRVLSGIALGLVMAVGTTWVTELAVWNNLPKAAGAKRASLSLTAGFLLGAAIAAALAQWLPYPGRVPYLLQALLSVATAIWLARAPVPETVPGGGNRTSTLRDDLRVPLIGHRRFLRVVIPLAPWVFTACGVAYAVLPGLLADHAGGYPIAFAGLMTLVALGTGILVQSFARRIDTEESARASGVAMACVVIGLVLAADAALTNSLVIGLFAAAVLGAGYGLALVAGLCEVARIAPSRQLAGLTAVFYSVAYLGFFVPMILSAIAEQSGGALFARYPAFTSYPMLIGALVVLALMCLTSILASWRLYLPHKWTYQPRR